MKGFQVYRNSSVEWRPSSVLALATSPDGSQVAAARDDGSLEIWLVSPGSIGWHCQLTIQGNSSSRVSSLVWCRSNLQKAQADRLLSSSIDGSISEWDLFSLQQKTVVDSVGVSIWQMALEPYNGPVQLSEIGPDTVADGFTDEDAHSDLECSEIDYDDESDITYTVSVGSEIQRLAVACDDGSIRLYNVSDPDGFTYNRAFPRASGRILSVAWSFDAKHVFSGTSDGLIRCWDTTSFHEKYRITVGLGGFGSGPELCVWSLLFLRCGTLVSGDSTGSVQFWDSHHGSLLQAHTYHMGDVKALVTIPGQSTVFSAGSDGQVIMYKLSDAAHEFGMKEYSIDQMKQWVYVGYVRAHTHDVQALTVAVPVVRKDSLPNEKVIKMRRQEKPISFNYHKWAGFEVPMLISAGDDAKLFAYSAREFTYFSPHDVCPAPQRPFIQLVHNTVIDGSPIILVQSSNSLDVMRIKLGSNASLSMPVGQRTTTQLIARVKSKGSLKIICSSISGTGALLAYSDHVKPNLFELKKLGKGGWSVHKMQLPRSLPSAHCMLFSMDSSCLILSGHDGRIYVVDVKNSEVTNTFVPHRKENDLNLPLREPPITKMFTSSDGRWLIAVNCFGDIYIFDLQIHRQHWFISRLNGASVIAGDFPPRNSDVFVVTTSLNQIYAFDVNGKQLSDWSRRHTYLLPRRFQEFPGEVIGLSFSPSLSSTSVIVYSTRAMCLIDLGMSIDQDKGSPKSSGLPTDKYETTKQPKANRKRKNQNEEAKSHNRSSDFCAFTDPVLFVGRITDNSLLIIEKQWMDVVQSFDAPVHRHFYGT